MLIANRLAEFETEFKLITWSSDLSSLSSFRQFDPLDDKNEVDDDVIDELCEFFEF